MRTSFGLAPTRRGSRPRRTGRAASTAEEISATATSRVGRERGELAGRHAGAPADHEGALEPSAPAARAAARRAPWWDSRPCVGAVGLAVREDRALALALERELVDGDGRDRIVVVEEQHAVGVERSRSPRAACRSAPAAARARGTGPPRARAGPSRAARARARARRRARAPPPCAGRATRTTAIAKAHRERGERGRGTLDRGRARRAADSRRAAPRRAIPPCSTHRAGPPRAPRSPWLCFALVEEQRQRRAREQHARPDREQQQRAARRPRTRRTRAFASPKASRSAWPGRARRPSTRVQPGEPQQQQPEVPGEPALAESAAAATPQGCPSDDARDEHRDDHRERVGRRAEGERRRCDSRRSGSPSSRSRTAARSPRTPRDRWRAPRALRSRAGAARARRPPEPHEARADRDVRRAPIASITRVEPEPRARSTKPAASAPTHAPAVLKAYTSAWKRVASARSRASACVSSGIVAAHQHGGREHEQGREAHVDGEARARAGRRQRQRSACTRREREREGERADADAASTAP